MGTCGRDGACDRMGHVTGCGGMWQGVEACGRSTGRVWGHVARGGCMSQGLGAYGRGGVGTCGRVWGHVTGCGGM